MKLSEKRLNEENNIEYDVYENDEFIGTIEYYESMYDDGIPPSWSFTIKIKSNDYKTKKEAIQALLNFNKKLE